MRGPARFSLVLFALVTLVLGLRFFTDLQSRGKIVILIAPIEGPGPETAEITERLTRVFAEPGRGNVVVRRLKGPITEEQGSGRARALGGSQRAALVVWGSLKSAGTEEFLTVVIEQLAPPPSLRVPSIGEYVVEGVLAEPRHFVLTTRLDAPSSPSVLLVKAVWQYQLGNRTEALHLLNVLLEGGLPEGRSALLLSRGNAALFSDQPQRALEDYATVLRSDPASPEAHTNLGLAYAVLKRYSAARAEDATALSLEPEEAAPYLNRGISHALLGEHQTAIAEYDHALRLDPRAAPAYLDRGTSRAALGDHRQAIEDFSRALAIIPDAAAYLNRGLSRAALGEHRQAVEDFSRALRMRPADPSALVARGRSRSALGDQAGAIADETAALEVAPQLATAYYERGIAYTVRGQYQQALDDFSTAIRINPKYAEAYKGRGISRLLRREYSQAFEDFSRAIQISPQDAEAFFHRGITYRLRGEPQKALPDLEKALGLSRDPALRKQVQEQLRQIQSEP